MGYVIPCARAKPPALAAFSSTSTPTTVTPLAAYFFDSASMVEASSLHGSHHDAKKFKYTGLPWNEALLSVPPPSAGPRPSRNNPANPILVEAGR